jgi:hypothetical protein
MSVPAAAAVPAAAGLLLQVEAARATVSFDILPFDLSALGAGFAAVGRYLTGDVRVVVLRGRDWSATPARSPGPGHLLGHETPSFALPGHEPSPGGAFPGSSPPPGSGGAPEERQGWEESQLEAVQAGTGWLSERADLLSVAALCGTVEGFGLDLALACDFRVACDDTVLRWRPAGSWPPALVGGQHALLGIVGYSRALEWRITGRRLTAMDAEAVGLVSRVVPPDHLADCLDDFVSGLLAAPRDAVAETKALLLNARERRDDRVAALRDQRDSFRRLC